MDKVLVIGFLKSAKQRIIDKGWCQGQSVDRDSRICASYALMDCCQEGLPRDLLQEVCGGARGRLGRAVIAKWSDAPGRTKEEVLAKYDEAIVLAEAL